MQLALYAMEAICADCTSVLTVLQRNIHKTLVFMHRVKTCSDIPNIFANTFACPFHIYPTYFSKKTQLCNT